MARLGGRLWGNALGGYKTQRRNDGKFASGKISGANIGGTAAQRRYNGYQASLANKKKKEKRKKVALIAGAAVLAGGGVLAYSQRENIATAGYGGVSRVKKARQSRNAPAINPANNTKVTKQNAHTPNAQKVLKAAGTATAIRTGGQLLTDLNRQQAESRRITRLGQVGQHGTGPSLADKGGSPSLIKRTDGISERASRPQYNRTMKPTSESIPNPGRPDYKVDLLKSDSRSNYRGYARGHLSDDEKEEAQFFNSSDPKRRSVAGFNSPDQIKNADDEAAVNALRIGRQSPSVQARAAEASARASANRPVTIETHGDARRVAQNKRARQRLAANPNYSAADINRDLAMGVSNPKSVQQWKAADSDELDQRIIQERKNSKFRSEMDRNQGFNLNDKNRRKGAGKKGSESSREASRVNTELANRRAGQEPNPIAGEALSGNVAKSYEAFVRAAVDMDKGERRGNVVTPGVDLTKAPSQSYAIPYMKKERRGYAPVPATQPAAISDAWVAKYEADVKAGKRRHRNERQAYKNYMGLGSGKQRGAAAFVVGFDSSDVDSKDWDRDGSFLSGKELIARQR